MAKSSIDKEISDLYDRRGKTEGAKYYQQKVEESWVDQKEIQTVDVPFYRSLFE
jgi:outer membrane protein assembly factor BamD